MVKHSRRSYQEVNPLDCVSHKYAKLKMHFFGGLAQSEEDLSAIHKIGCHITYASVSHIFILKLHGAAKATALLLFMGIQDQD